MKTKTLLLPNQSLYGKSWRDHLLIHPAAELFPRMSPAELRALGEDIKQNGLTSPIVLWSDRKSPGVLLDGRNRLDAIEMATGPVTVGAPSIMAGKEFLALDKVIVLDKSVDPYGFVISANIHRRHLSIEDKDRLIVKVLQADPTKSNRQVAEMVKASHPHVAKVRKQAEKAGDVETVTTSIDTKGRKQPSRRNRIPSLHRAAKLGEETVAKIKGTSLNNAREMDELVVLNRGAAKGELTPIVKRLVEDAAAGKDVSAIAEVAKIKGGAPSQRSKFRKRSWCSAPPPPNAFAHLWAARRTTTSAPPATARPSACARAARSWKMKRTGSNGRTSRSRRRSPN
jgi:DNA-binding Lrp family transcriptional regulator